MKWLPQMWPELPCKYSSWSVEMLIRRDNFEFAAVLKVICLPDAEDPRANVYVELTFSLTERPLHFLPERS